MSNIIKWNYISFDQADKHVIDSDRRSRRRTNLSEEEEQRMLESIHIATPQEIADNFLKKQENSGGGFADGSNSADYDKRMEEERKRIAREADSLLSNARQKAEEILAETNGQVEEIKALAFEQGRQEGFDAGFQQGQEALREKEAELARQEEDIFARRQQQEEEYQQRIGELEPFFTELTMSLLEKITGVVVENKKDVILHLIKSGIEDAGQSQHFCIHVSSEDLPVVQEAKERLEEKLSGGGSIEIREDISLSPNQCMIETDSRMIDSSLGIQLRNLVEDLRLLSVSR